MDKPTVCVKCEFYPIQSKQEPVGLNLCKSPDAPITDFVTGIKECDQINLGGKCKYYKP